MRTVEREKTFYLAGSYSARKRLYAESRILTGATGIRCTSRWLKGLHDGVKPKKCAQDDIEDVEAAVVFILYLDKPSTTGGMWVELGLALAQHKEIYIISEGEAGNAACFAHLVPRDRWYDDFDELGLALKVDNAD